MEAYLARLLGNLDPWLVVGLAGQMLFSARFLLQWIASEKQRRSVIPVAFWWFSIGGGLTLLVYAVSRADPVFILGQGAGLVIYTRNLYFIYREKRDGGAADRPAAERV